MFRNRLWYDLAQAKFNEIYLCHIITSKRRLLNTFNILLAVFSTAGVMGWKVWEYAPFIACIIVAVISLLKLIQPYIIPSDKQLEKLDKVCDFYCDSYLKLDQIFYEFESGTIPEFEARKKFMEIKQKEREINLIINEVHRKKSKKYSELASAESKVFINRVYNS